ncbi:MAG TPA: DNA cytosine methyltransferase [Ohtaekwangia sp.]|nr:DNA cytosine methyltransferase [Ohtaekwangia sp.]
MSLTVLDFFCGAGGFSEGFRQQGFTIIQGVDHWRPAIDTFNANFNLTCEVKNVLDFKSLDEILTLPDTDVIIGSPPCVSFSNSNRSGKADKSMGLQLTETFLKIVAVKKHQKRSTLKAWFMENVPNCLRYLPKQYSFRQLGLAQWAVKNDKDPSEIAIKISGNSLILNSADYGSPQSRKRAVLGEIIHFEKLISPTKTHRTPSEPASLPVYTTLKQIRMNLPSPNSKSSLELVQDPIYEIQLPLNDLTDQFYDTGLYESQWKSSRSLKLNHPFMGRMSFPENESKPSRTITATNIGTSRESMIFESEYKRTGDGQYRVPTVREMACIMGFPITFQFFGSEGTKTRLIGNAVCPSVSSALAKTVRVSLGLKPIKAKIAKTINLKGIPNLNTFSERVFNDPPIKKPGSRFRLHPFKFGNITVTLSNYNISTNSSIRKWRTSVQYGNGKGFPSENFPDNYYKTIEPLIEQFESGKKFIEIINNGFSEKIASSEEMQAMHEAQQSKGCYLEPVKLVEEVARIITGFKFDEEEFAQCEDSKVFKHKINVPKKQFLALYAINKIVSVANEK